MIRLNVLRERSMAVMTENRSSFINTTSAASMAMSVPTKKNKRGERGGENNSLPFGHTAPFLILSSPLSHSPSSSAPPFSAIPVPIASPTSACAREGASLMPSPTITTLLPSAWRSLISPHFSFGSKPSKR